MISNMFTVCPSVHLFFHPPTPTPPHSAGQFNFMWITHHSKGREAKEYFFGNQCCLIQSDFIMTRTERIFKHSFDLKLVELRVWNESLKLNELWGKNSWATRLLLAGIRDAVQQQSLNSDRCVAEARKGNISEHASEEAGQKRQLSQTLWLQGYKDGLIGGKNKKLIVYYSIRWSVSLRTGSFCGSSSTSADTNETWQATDQSVQ